MSALGRVRLLGRRLLARRRYRRSVTAISVVYLVAFLFAIQDLTVPGGPVALTTGSPGAMFRRTGFVLFDAIALVQTPLFALLVSPLNIAIGLMLSVLVGLNLTMSFVAWRNPNACSTDRAAGIFGILPGLLGGGACCAPTILLIAGIQATAALLTAIQWMIPIAFLLLVASLAWISFKTNPDSV